MQPDRSARSDKPFEKLKRMSLYRRHIISYAGIALAALLLFAYGIFMVSGNEFRREMIDEQTNKLTVAVQDIDNQVDIMRTLSYVISNSPLYKPQYLQANGYHGRVMLDSFAMYKSYSALIDRYFILYRQDGAVFSDTAKYTSLELYAQAAHLACYWDGLSEEIEAAERMSFVKLSSESALLVFPMHLGAIATAPYNAFLCFELGADMVFQRTQNTSGGLPANLMLSWNGTPLFGRVEQSIIAAGAGDFTLSMSADDLREMSSVKRFRTISFIMILVSAVALLTIALVAAYFNWQPMRRLLQRYRLGDKKDDIRAIEAFMDENIRGRTEARRQMADMIQKVAVYTGYMKEQLIRLLFSGGYSEDMNSRLDEMGLMTERAHYAVALVDLADADESACGALQKMLEQFRGEQFSFESLVLKEQGRLGVLICFDYGDQAQDAREALEDMCSAADIHTTLRMGTIVDALADIPDSLMAAISDGRQDTRQRYEALDCDAQIRRLCRAIRMRSADSVREHLNSIFDMMEKNRPDADLCQLMRAELTRQMAKTAQDLDEDLPEMPTETEAFMRQTEAFAAKLCERAAEYEPSRAAERNQRLIQYIEDHLTDNALSLEWLADQFSLSPRQVGRIVKAETGRTFIEQVTHLRIKKALSILTEPDMTVVVASGKLGFSSAGYFIKVFKEQVGVTPTTFQKKLRENDMNIEETLIRIEEEKTVNGDDGESA